MILTLVIIYGFPQFRGIIYGFSQLLRLLAEIVSHYHFEVAWVIISTFVRQNGHFVLNISQFCYKIPLFWVNPPGKFRSFWKQKTVILIKYELLLISFKKRTVPSVKQLVSYNYKSGLISETSNRLIRGTSYPLHPLRRRGLWADSAVRSLPEIGTGGKWNCKPRVFHVTRFTRLCHRKSFSTRSCFRLGLTAYNLLPELPKHAGVHLRYIVVSILWYPLRSYITPDFLGRG